MTVYLPLIVAIIYLATGAAYAWRADWAWAVVWWGYSIAQIGLVVAGNR